MLSERHNTRKICDWLERFRLASGVIPDECIVDGSLALLNAICLAFNNCSHLENLIASHTFLIGEISELKHCFIRDDKNHFMKAFTNLKCWKLNDNESKKKFYTHCLGFCTGITDFQMIKEVFIHLFIISQSPFCNTGSECQKSQQWLATKISKFDYSIDKLETTDDVQADYSYMEEEDCIMTTRNILIQFIDDTNGKAKKMLDTLSSHLSNPNPYYCLELVAVLKKIFLRYSTWSNVMQKHYGSTDDTGTSARSESYFSILKKGLQRMGAHVFVLQHLEHIKGEINFAKAAFENKYNSIPPEFRQKHTSGKEVI